jgi:hypothetical protein
MATRAISDPIILFWVGEKQPPTQNKTLVRHSHHSILPQPPPNQWAADLLIFLYLLQ